MGFSGKLFRKNAFLPPQFHIQVGLPGWGRLRLQVLEQDPLILKTPLVRRGKDLTVGLDEANWRRWAAG